MTHFVSHQKQKTRLSNVFSLWSKSFPDLRCQVMSRKNEVVGYCCLTMPLSLLPLILQQCWMHISCSLQSKQHKTFLHHIAGTHFVWPQSQEIVDERHILKFTLNPELFQDTADIIRGQQMQVDDSEEVILPVKRSKDDILYWCDSMAVHSRFELRHLLKDQHGSNVICGYTTESLLLCLRLCNCLKGASSLRRAVVLAGEVIGLPQGWTSPDAKSVSKTTILRHRFSVDCALTLVVRWWLSSLYENHIEIVAILLVDGSPRMGKEWIFSELYIILKVDLEKVRRAKEAILQERKKDNPDADVIKTQSKIIDKAACRHVCTPTATGARNLNMAVKWLCCVHQCRLLCDGWAMGARALVNQRLAG